MGLTVASDQPRPVNRKRLPEHSADRHRVKSGRRHAAKTKNKSPQPDAVRQPPDLLQRSLHALPQCQRQKTVRGMPYGNALIRFRRHRRRNRHHIGMARRKLYHDSRKNVRIVAFVFFFTGTPVATSKGSCPMESRRMLLCRSIALALLGQNMDQDAVFCAASPRG